MPELSPLEILVVAAVAFIVFGPERLPVIARQLGRQLSRLRALLAEVKEEMSFDLDEEDELEPPIARISREQKAERHRRAAEDDKEAPAPAPADAVDPLEGGPEPHEEPDTGADPRPRPERP
jgi:sec-independent protein translocase protein TatB